MAFEGNEGQNKGQRSDIWSQEHSAEQGKAELRIFNFKTTWSEFPKPSQTAATRGEAELRILNFKTTWLEFQKLKRRLLQIALHYLSMWF